MNEPMPCPTLVQPDNVRVCVCVCACVCYVQNSITPLHVAAKWGRKAMVALLLDTGATIDARTRVTV